MNTIVLRAENVSYFYKNRYQVVEAVKDVTLSFERGKVYAIVGSSGSGKTTFLSLLGGLDSPTNGEIYYGDESVRSMNKEVYRRTKTCFIYQNYNLFPMLNSIENVSFPLWLAGNKNKKAEKLAKDALSKVDLGDSFYRRLPRQLSGGQQQRVAIARALVTGAGVILADEPTGNLDSVNGTQVFNLLKKLAKEQDTTVIIATHDNEMADLCDVKIEIKDGAVVNNAV